MKTKTLLLAIITIALSAPLVAQNQLTIGNGYELSYTPEESYKIKAAEEAYYLITDFGNIKWRYQLRLKYKNFALFSNTSIYMNYGGSLKFKPTSALFDIDLRYKYKKFCLSIGHRCIHPIITDDLQSLTRNKFYGGYDIKINLKYNIE